MPDDCCKLTWMNVDFVIQPSLLSMTQSGEDGKVQIDASACTIQINGSKEEMRKDLDPAMFWSLQLRANDASSRPPLEYFLSLPRFVLLDSIPTFPEPATRPHHDIVPCNVCRLHRRAIACQIVPDYPLILAGSGRYAHRISVM